MKKFTIPNVAPTHNEKGERLNQGHQVEYDVKAYYNIEWKFDNANHKNCGDLTINGKPVNVKSVKGTMIRVPQYNNVFDVWTEQERENAFYNTVVDYIKNDFSKILIFGYPAKDGKRDILILEGFEEICLFLYTCCNFSDDRHRKTANEYLKCIVLRLSKASKMNINRIMNKLQTINA